MMLLKLEGAALARKHDYAVSIGVTAIIVGLFVIGGITYTYMTRPALIEAAAKRVLNIRQVFEDTFR
jgi:mannose/fructose/N-acetylgalactosamine-specific phosphotransferase system component IID